ncbi:MAG TPA: family 1 glycosylhydrolase, partial [Glaciihabitans sp.]|nr:family 1 glycosylhydrolase [Glaciihabitans sp.]
MSMEFPPGFIWGSATAAAQIEGAAHLDGKEDSIWDAFARVPGAIANGHTPEVAVDHYHRMSDDVALMKELGLQSYRFSTSWARVKPGDRTANAKGLDFYSRLVDELLEANILPWLTLYHWDLPQTLEEAGGWATRDTAYRFADYASLVHSALGDRVTHWTTFNEPLCSSLIGYAAGEHAPGRREPAAALAAVHHQHLAHGLATRALRELGAEKIGITLNLTNAVPNDQADPVDLEAARRIDGLWNRMFLEPLLLSKYPEDVL